MAPTSLLGTWVAQKPFRPDEPTSEDWFHFCADGYLAHESFDATYRWNRNWYLYEVHDSGRISRVCLGSYARKFFTSENPRDLLFRKDEAILFINDHPFIESSERPLPERYDLLSGIHEIKGGKTEIWSQKFNLIDPKEIEPCVPANPLQR